MLDVIRLVYTTVAAYVVAEVVERLRHALPAWWRWLPG